MGRFVEKIFRIQAKGGEASPIAPTLNTPLSSVV